MNHCKPAGFTLIEILVIVGVIIILAAVLFPVFESVREHGRQTTCLSNMRQLGAGLLMYAQDNDAHFPEGTQPYSRGVAVPGELGGKPSGIGWAGQVFAYVKNTAVFKCPDDTTQALPAQGLKTYVVSYALNSVFSSNTFSIVSPYKSHVGLSNLVLLAEVKGASAAITLPDEGASAGASKFSPAGDALSALYVNPIPFAGAPMFTVTYATGNLDLGADDPFFSSPRHGDGADYLMTDGHVKWLPPSVVCQPYPRSMKISRCAVEF